METRSCRGSVTNDKTLEFVFKNKTKSLVGNNERFLHSWLGSSPIDAKKMMLWSVGNCQILYFIVKFEKLNKLKYNI